jgi:putative transposase
VRKNYQTRAATVATAEIVAVPETVSVAMAELAGAVKEGLLALAVGVGLQVMAAVMEEDVVAVAGPRGRHDRDRTAVRHGSEAGSVTLGGRRVPVRRPRVRASNGSGELPVGAYELFSSTELLGELALERMMAKLSTRRYTAGLEPVGEVARFVVELEGGPDGEAMRHGRRNREVVGGGQRRGRRVGGSL